MSSLAGSVGAARRRREMNVSAAAGPRVRRRTGAWRLASLVLASALVAACGQAQGTADSTTPAAGQGGAGSALVVTPPAPPPITVQPIDAAGAPVPLAQCATMPVPVRQPTADSAARRGVLPAVAAETAVHRRASSHIAAGPHARARRVAIAHRKVVRKRPPWNPRVVRTRPGSILPGCRIVAYYGNPFSKRMGILGELPPSEMLARLRTQARAYAAADSGVPVVPALELIATVAQGSPGKGALYRLRMPGKLIDRVAHWADSLHYLLILDVQPGRSSIAAELRPLLPYLREPNVHLALDPEFAMHGTRVPGRVIGTLDASEVNDAVHVLASLVDSLHLPPKVLIVHRFTRPMLTHANRIAVDPRVQVVIDMDGFGAPRLKRSSYDAYIRREPVEFAGFKLFYKNDHPLLTPRQVLGLDPVPIYIMYQ